MNKLFATLLVFIGIATVSAQSRLTVAAHDTLAFLLYVGETQVNLVPVTSITVEDVTPGKVNLRAVFRNQTEVSQLVVLKESLHHQLDLHITRGAMKFNLTSENSYTRILPVASDSALVQAPVSGTEAGMNYTGAIGCEQFLSDADFETFRENLQTITFEFKRTEAMIPFVAGQCLTVEQLRSLLSLLELEDNRMRVVEGAVGHIYDVGRLSELEGDFYLQKNKQRVRSLITG